MLGSKGISKFSEPCSVYTHLRNTGVEQLAQVLSRKYNHRDKRHSFTVLCTFYILVYKLQYVGES